MQYTTCTKKRSVSGMLFYQDFKDTFVCNTQHACSPINSSPCCFIRISKIHLYAIHNRGYRSPQGRHVVLSGFQRYICMQYTTLACVTAQCVCCFIRISKIHLYAIHNTESWRYRNCVVVLSGFQRYICMQYTTLSPAPPHATWLFYQDFKDTFVCNTQQSDAAPFDYNVVLSGFQRYICMQYTTSQTTLNQQIKLFYQDFKDTFVCNTQLLGFLTINLLRCFIRISKIHLYANVTGHTSITNLILLQNYKNNIKHTNSYKRFMIVWK